MDKSIIGGRQCAKGEIISTLRRWFTCELSQSVLDMPLFPIILNGFILGLLNAITTDNLNKRGERYEEQDKKNINS
ncbi:MAG TPA: hypothetical protein VKI61_06010 [Chitinophagaceae bacterium]|nr:hypothetical protein [Chitinophagaceae bacterium]